MSSVEKIIKTAIFDPGFYTSRGYVQKDGKSDYSEPVWEWCVRAVFNGLEANGLEITAVPKKKE